MGKAIVNLLSKQKIKPNYLKLLTLNVAFFKQPSTNQMDCAHLSDRLFQNNVMSR